MIRQLPDQATITIVLKHNISRIKVENVFFLCVCLYTTFYIISVWQVNSDRLSQPNSLVECGQWYNWHVILVLKCKVQFQIWHDSCEQVKTLIIAYLYFVLLYLLKNMKLVKSLFSPQPFTNRAPCCSTCMSWPRSRSPCPHWATIACSLSMPRTRCLSSIRKAWWCLCPPMTPCSSTTPRSEPLVTT